MPTARMFFVLMLSLLNFRNARSRRSSAAVYKAHSPSNKQGNALRDHAIALLLPRYLILPGRA